MDKITASSTSGGCDCVVEKRESGDKGLIRIIISLFLVLYELHSVLLCSCSCTAVMVADITVKSSLFSVI